MKIVLLNYTKGCIDIYLVKKEEEKMFDVDDFDLELFLAEKGYDTSNCLYMVHYEENVPVYLYGIDAPYTYL